ncbi:DUF1569 domain-containing protein [Moheibacter lacus]|uniref:DUF1569 domain-containing protein n=1 Tax=Moheibacter lacus TaxID=2745851 RepID=A0A838ZT50_9FLAO|nr:DUF1569 domain-containing protein [Moheibacter lacus]MBA5630164.1 DUF1569 domain-containing protein [Moheibacter lacus]
MKNIFQGNTTQELIDRVNQLTPETKGHWGKMSVDQMLAHCNVAYDMTFTDKYPKPGFLKKFLLKTFIKPGTVGENPYPKNGRTAPQFIIKDRRDFDLEKQKLVDYLQKTHNLGAEHFEGMESHSFGKLNQQEWSNLFYKHLDHHLTQFGV